jgi:hypothetical protein
MLGIFMAFSIKKGSYSIQPNTQVPFGVGNLRSGVGIIARLDDGTHFCAHLEVENNPKTQAERDAMTSAVETWLTWAIPLANVTEMWYSTRSVLAAAFCIIAGIKSVCPAVHGYASSTLYFSGDGEMNANENQVELGRIVSGICRF